MGTETDTKTSDSSEIQPLAEFDPNKEPVAELDEREVIEPLKKTTDDAADREQDNEPGTPDNKGAEEGEIPLEGVDRQTESNVEAATGDASDESEIHLDQAVGEGDEPDADGISIPLANASEDPDGDDGDDAGAEAKDSDPNADGSSSVKKEQPAADEPKEPAENNDDGAADEAEAEDFDPDDDDTSSDEKEEPAGESPEESAADTHENDFAGLDDDDIGNGIASRSKKEDRAAGGDETQEKPDPAPAKSKAAIHKAPGKIKKSGKQIEPLPKGAPAGHKGRRPAGDATTPKKITVSIIIILMVAGAVIYSKPALLNLKGKPDDGLPATAEIKPPAEQTEIQTRKPAPAGINDHYLAKIEDVTRLRDELLAKREEIYRLKLYYRNGIAELTDQLYREMRDAHISSFSQALENKRIELGLRTIQRREVYIQELEKPDQWVHKGSEELLFLKRKALLDLQMTDIASGIDLNRHMRYMNAAIQKYQPSADKLAVDPPPAKLTPLETIWRQIYNQQTEQVQVPIGPKNEKIIAEICSGDFGRIAELTAITPEAAKCVARMKGSELFLNGVTQLAPEEAKYLFKWQGNWICLNSVKNLSPAVAKHLFKWEGNWISLNGLTDLQPELALYLTEWKGNQLELMGLNCKRSKPDKRTLKYLALWETMGGKLFVSEDVRNEMARVM